MEVNAEVIPTAKIVIRSRQIVLSSDGKTEGFSFSVTYFFTVSFSFLYAVSGNSTLHNYMTLYTTLSIQFKYIL